MKAVVQRVREASVSIEGQEVSRIGEGFLLLLGIGHDDAEADIEYLCQKVVKLRVFDDFDGVMNLPITALDGADVLVVSQFTLMASTRKGNRPSYVHAAPPEVSRPLYERFVERLRELTGGEVPTGQFGADMQVALVNDGPVTILIDSKER